jgi:hypothetical protein
LSSSDEDQQTKKIYNNILLSRDFTDKKKGVKALGSYGKKAIPFIQELHSIEMFDIITQIEKVDNLKKYFLIDFPFGATLEEINCLFEHHTIMCVIRHY